MKRTLSMDQLSTVLELRNKFFITAAMEAEERWKMNLAYHPDASCPFEIQEDIRMINKAILENMAIQSGHIEDRQIQLALS